MSKRKAFFLKGITFFIIFFRESNWTTFDSAHLSTHCPSYMSAIHSTLYSTHQYPHLPTILATLWPTDKLPDRTAYLSAFHTAIWST
jgi:hypothetical protein